MNRWAGPIIATIVLAGVVHVATVVAMPNVIMLVVLRGTAEKAGGANHFLHSMRTTPQSQTVVRPSPDLAYSACSIDVSNGPVKVVVNRTVTPAVVALYGENTDTIWSTGGLVMLPGDASTASPLRLLLSRDQAAPMPQSGTTPVKLKSDKALLLVRRLAPTAEAFAAVDAERRGDICEAVKMQSRQP